MRAQATRQLARLALLALGFVGSCGGVGDEEDILLMPDETPSLLDGRAFDVTVHDGTSSRRLAVRVGSDDPVLAEMLTYLEDVCVREAHLMERFESSVVELSRDYTARAPSCGVDGARQQQLLLCMGHKLLGMSESVMPMDFIGSSLSGFELRARRLVEEIPEPRATALLTIPVQDNESRATLAIWSAMAFQRAALLGAHLTDPTTCEEGSLAATLPPYDADGSRVPLAFVVASATSEAMHQMMDAVERGQHEVRAAATIERGRDSDPRRGAARMFRGPRNSLLAATGLMLRTPLRMYDPPLSRFGEPEGEPGEYEACVDEPDGEVDSIAMDLVESLAVDPRVTPDELSNGVLEGRVRTALVARVPGLFTHLEGTSDAEFFRHVGTSAGAVRRAGTRAETRARVLGRVIVDDGVVDGVPRIRGTTRQRTPSPAAFRYARVAGAARIHHDEGDGFHPATSYGDFDVASLAVTSSGNEYGRGPALEALDLAATALSLAAGRADMRRVVEPSGATLEFEDATELAAAARVFGRERVPLRAQVCVGNASGDGVDRARVRLFGADAADPSRYEIWIGEAGLQCAMTGRVEGEPCVDDAHRVAPEVSRMETGASLSGFGTDFVEADVHPGDLPGRATAVPLQRLYVTERAPSGGRRAVLGFMPEPAAVGSGDPRWNRCTNLPAGERGIAATEPLATDGVDCTQAEDTCAGLPLDAQIPLEDEIAEALGGIGSDDLETSFAHYLQIARQAADEADALGQQLVQHGLELDLRAEAAAEAVQSICGITIPVLHLPGSFTCTDSDDCLVLPGNHGHGAGYSCVAGSCQPNSVLTYVEPGPDTERVQGCLLDGHDGGVVNLGEESVCIWRVDGGAPCATNGIAELVDLAEGPGCPWPKNASGTCTLDLDPLPAGVTYGPTEALGVVQGQAPVALSEGSCNGIGAIIHDPGGVPDVAAGVVASTWLRHSRFDAVASALRWRQGPLSFSSIGGHTNTWASLGSLLNGASQGWPCAPMPGVNMDFCTETPGNRRPLACGFDCSTSQSRRAADHRLRSALAAMQALAGRRFGHVVTRNVQYAEMPGTWLVETRTILGRIDDYPFLAGPGEDLCNSAGFGDSGSCFDILSGPQNATVVQNGFYGADSNYNHLTLATASAPLSSAPFDIRYGINAFISESPNDPLGAPSPIPQAPIHEIWTSFIPYFLAMYAQFGDTAAPPGQVFDANSYTGWAPWWLQSTLYNTVYHHYTSMYNNDVGARTLPDRELRNYEVLHGLELGCLALQGGSAALSCGPLASTSSVGSLDDLERVAAHVQCQSDAFEAGASRILFTDIPPSLVSEIRQSSVSSTYPAYGGQYGSAMASLQAELRAIPTSVGSMSSAMRDVGNALAVASANVRIDNLEDDYASLATTHSAVGHVTQCVAALASVASSDIISGIGQTVAAGATCAGGLVQMILESQMAEVQDEIRRETLRIHLLTAAEAIADASDRLYGAAESFNQSVGRINALLAELDTLRSQARGEMGKALVWSSNAVTGQEYPVNDVMRARLSTDRIRYERAHGNAVRLAWLARRAIEQRLGVDLQHLTQEMTLVDAPSKWAGSVCGMGGINYARIRGELEGPISDYADEFVGDYVRQLELFLQSYRIDHPFENGRDVAVVSLRDDVLNVRETCDAESYNLFTSSIDPTTGWTTTCNAPDERCPIVSWAQGGPFRSRTDSMGNPWLRPYGEADAFDLGSACPEAAVDTSTAPWECDPAIAAGGGSLHQSFELPEGTYLVSWYEPLPTPIADCTPTLALCTGCSEDDAGCLGQCEDTCVATQCATEEATSAPRVTLVVAGDATLAPPDQAQATTPERIAPADPWLDSCNWRRASARITVPVAQTVQVGFRVDVDPGDELSLLVQRGWAAPQLEALAPHEAALPSIPPRNYFPSDDDGIMPFAVCPDGDGSTFRSEQHWERGCEYLCGDGIGEACASIDPADRARVRCYRETRFHIGQDAVERGELLATAGFAHGNYNYRHATLALNVVGTEVLDCTTASNPSACYANAYVPYSIYQDGPFVVRNHWGDDYDAPLFPGRIEHAKGLTAERYLTNPLSGADRGLLTDYWRPEFRGRPLAGEYRLRIYDTPGLQWTSVEDVQLLVDYRYWTRSR